MVVQTLVCLYRHVDASVAAGQFSGAVNERPAGPNKLWLCTCGWVTACATPLQLGSVSILYCCAYFAVCVCLHSGGTSGAAVLLVRSFVDPVPGLVAGVGGLGLGCSGWVLSGAVVLWCVGLLQGEWGSSG